MQLSKIAQATHEQRELFSLTSFFVRDFDLYFNTCTLLVAASSEHLNSYYYLTLASTHLRKKIPVSN